MGRLVLLILYCAYLCGCQTSTAGGSADAPAASLPADVAALVASDMASRLSEQLPRSSGPLKLADEASDFAIALATSLKTSGYRIASGTLPQPQTIALAYRLDRSGSELLASLSTPRLRLARLYLVSGSQATPASPLSVMILQ